MNIFKFELSRKKASVLIWSVGIIILIFISIAPYSSFAADVEALEEIFRSYPPELLSAFGMNDIDLSSIVGYLALMYPFIQFFLAVQAANYGFALLSIEEREKVADFLLVKPVSRTKILVSKIFAGLLALTASILIISCAQYVILLLLNGDEPLDSEVLLKLSVGYWLFSLTFYFLSIAISVLIKKIKSVLPFSMGLVTITYFIGVLADITNSNIYNYLTPFKCFSPTTIIENRGFLLENILISAVLILGSIVLAVIVYNKKDIQGV